MKIPSPAQIDNQNNHYSQSKPVQSQVINYSLMVDKPLKLRMYVGLEPLSLCHSSNLLMP